MFGHIGNAQQPDNGSHDMANSVDAAAQSFDDSIKGGPKPSFGSGPVMVAPSGNGNDAHDLPGNSAPSSDPAGPPPPGGTGSAPPLSLPGPDPGAKPAQPPADPADEALLDIKQDALQHLQPLVGQLDQPPEEKFRTIMMMIQAADDQSLIKSAYDTAQQISDDKLRAQALLDIVNEINYFTRKPS